MTNLTRDTLVDSISSVKSTLREGIEHSQPGSPLNAALQDALERTEEWEVLIVSAEKSGRDAVQIAVETAGWVRVAIEVLGHFL